MKLCTLALGEKYLLLAQRLRDSLPLEIEICTEICKDVPVRNGDSRYDYHHKRFAIEEHYDPDGTLFLDADAICVDHAEFLAFLERLALLPPGIYSPYVYSSYGFKHPNMPDKVIDRSRLTPVLRYLDSVMELAEPDLLSFRMPFEWLLFFRFENPQQRTTFFERYRQLHAILIGGACTLANECNLIGLAAQHCGLPVFELQKVAGIRHKK